MANPGMSVLIVPSLNIPEMGGVMMKLTVNATEDESRTT